MNIKNLSWEQIKELAEMAIKNGCDFSLMLEADGDCSVDISKHDYSYITVPTPKEMDDESTPGTQIKTRLSYM